MRWHVNEKTALQGASHLAHCVNEGICKKGVGFSVV
jgi:hypothetical protein